MAAEPGSTRAEKLKELDRIFFEVTRAVGNSLDTQPKGPTVTVGGLGNLVAKTAILCLGMGGVTDARKIDDPDKLGRIFDNIAACASDLREKHVKQSVEGLVTMGRQALEDLRSIP